MDIFKWIEENELTVTNHNPNNNTLVINEKTFLIISPDIDGKIITKDFELNVGPTEADIRCDYYLYYFGDNWYYTESAVDPEFKIFRYIGKTDGLVVPYLGVHGPYELCNGARDYSDFCQKANFTGVNVLGICEKDTLAGTLAFQLACEKNNITPILGETVSVQGDDDEYFLKLYVKNDIGWNNLLYINKAIRVGGAGFVLEEEVLKRAEGLFCVFHPWIHLSKERVSKFRKAFGHSLAYQFDPVKYKSPEKDREHLEYLKEYFSLYRKTISPILITDGYYLEPQDFHIKKKLNVLGKVFDFQSEDQCFKTPEDTYLVLDSFIEDKDKLDGFFMDMVAMAELVAEECTFKIPIGEFHLPQYEITKEQSQHYAVSQDDIEGLIYNLIGLGLRKKGFSEDAVYWDRIESEMDIISKGGFIDYFLILWDIIEWCNQEDILVGVGRGSAGGSLVAWLLGITKLDPIEHGLLFERFLNEGRIGKSLPDIDTDFQGERRDDVKRYIEDRYGKENVCAIGTYTTLKNKAALKDLGRQAKIPPQTMNYMTAFLDGEGSWYNIFETALESPQFMKFVRDNSSLVNDIRLLHGQRKTASVHAAGVIITPKTYKGKSMTIFDWIPVKEMDGLLISEWEGPDLETAGYLKEDILGIKQLDKFAAIFRLMEEHGHEIPDFESINYNDPKVYELFKKGFNQDLFHFGSVGLTSYSMDVEPENLEELIAMISLYRPGPMESGAHKQYISLRAGDSTPSYDFHLTGVTEHTYGLYIYQEQIMQAVQVLGGFTLTEADDIRKAMGKKNIKNMDAYKGPFLKNAIEKGCPQHEAEEIWEKLAVFSGYGFNKSHAAAYAMTGYFCQYLKHYFPLEFWTTSLEYSTDTQLPGRINEIFQDDSLRLVPPDVNTSSVMVKPDQDSYKIYWALNKIKFVGDSAVEAVMEERDANGHFFSLEEFHERLPKSKVDSRALMNMILSGCFDEIEKVEEPLDRQRLVDQWFFLTKKKEKDTPSIFTGMTLNKNYSWTMMQKKLSGLGHLDYSEIMSEVRIPGKFITPDKIHSEKLLGTKVVLAGILIEILEKKSRNGKFCQLKLSANEIDFEATIWNEAYETNKELLEKAVGRILIFSGKITTDKYIQQRQVIHSNRSTKFEML